MSDNHRTHGTAGNGHHQEGRSAANCPKKQVVALTSLTRGRHLQCQGWMRNTQPLSEEMIDGFTCVSDRARVSFGCLRQHVTYHLVKVLSGTESQSVPLIEQPSDRRLERSRA